LLQLLSGLQTVCKHEGSGGCRPVEFIANPTQELQREFTVLISAAVANKLILSVHEQLMLIARPSLAKIYLEKNLLSSSNEFADVLLFKIDRSPVNAHPSIVHSCVSAGCCSATTSAALMQNPFNTPARLLRCQPGSQCHGEIKLFCSIEGIEFKSFKTGSCICFLN
jgi:hypothetical protein